MKVKGGVGLGSPLFRRRCKTLFHVTQTHTPESCPKNVGVGTVKSCMVNMKDKYDKSTK